MRKEMFSENGNWYKGNLHSHTTNSDGRLRPEEAAEVAEAAGPPEAVAVEIHF